MAIPRVLVLRTAGTNCDQETRHALELAGAAVEIIHVNSLIASGADLSGRQMLVLPGGFTYGDDVAAGKVLALELMYSLRSQLEDFILGGGLVLGICNGFQSLVKSGLLPGAGMAAAAERTVTLTHNVSGRFEARWVHLRSPHNVNCVFSVPEEDLELPVAHGEGRLVVRDPKILKQMCDNGQIVYRYASRSGGVPSYPEDPNGSVDNIAGICDKSGRVFGLMPHPERYVYGHQHPRWTREGGGGGEGAGLRIFRRAVDYFKKD